ncbi:hypothetical protein FHS21_003525 [Phyllobacterium trifolii]|uniref:Uncharacterized protein n=1 Tax=Phyllobacterium trifolii TaxID=300193 RepID=A0A839UF53_9HYPH|nr:hypothetical protein [Phyllobacterium trifolii]
MVSPIQPAIKELEAAGQAVAAVNEINDQFGLNIAHFNVRTRISVPGTKPRSVSLHRAVRRRSCRSTISYTPSRYRAFRAQHLSRGHCNLNLPVILMTDNAL